MIRGLIVALLGASLMGCAMDTGDDPTTETTDTTEAQGMGMSRGFQVIHLGQASDTDRCGNPHRRIVELPQAIEQQNLQVQQVTR